MGAGTVSQSRSPVGLLVAVRMGLFAFNGLMGPLLPLLARTWGTGLGTAAAVAAVTPMAWALGSVGLTPWARRLGARTLMRWGCLAMAVFSALTGATPWMPAVVLSRVIGGMAGGAVGPASQVYLVDAYQGPARARAFGWVAVGYALGGLALVPVLVLVAHRWGPAWAFGALGGWLAALTVAMGLSLSQDRPAGPIQTAEPFAATLLAAWRTPARGPLFANLLERCVNTAVITYLPVLLAVRLHAPAPVVALAVAVVAAASGMGSWVGGRIVVEAVGVMRARYLYAGGLAVAIVPVALTFADPGPWWGAVVAGALYAMIAGVVRPPYLGVVAQLAPPESAMAWNAVGNQGGITLGTAVPGFLLGVWGFGGVVVWATVLSAAAVTAMLRGSNAGGPRGNRSLPSRLC